METCSSHPQPPRLYSAAAYRWRSHQWGGRAAEASKAASAPKFLTIGTFAARPSAPSNPGAQPRRGRGSQRISGPVGGSLAPALSSLCTLIVRNRPNRVLIGLEGGVAVFQGQAHSAAMAKWRTTPNQDQRKLESPLASFPLSPRQRPGVGTGGVGRRVKNNLEDCCGESGEGIFSEYIETQIPFFTLGCSSFLGVH